MLRISYVSCAVLLCYFVASADSFDDSFKEELMIKPLATGEVYAQFRFVVEKALGPENNAFKHFRLLPRSLGDIISKNSVQELHFSLTQGLWRYEKWGYPHRDAPPGAEVWAWFQKDTKDVDSSWRNLVNVLSGQFCASLNFVDKTKTVQPLFSYRPEGAVPLEASYNSSFLRYATLPSEIICTENLTPFKKLLPCDTKAGLSTLLNAVNLFNAHFVSLAIDSKTICKVENCSMTAVEFTQSVAVVFDPPALQQGKQDWSLVKLFGASLMSKCPVASSSMIYVDITLNKTGIPFSLRPLPPEKFGSVMAMGPNAVLVYNLEEFGQQSKPLNIMAVYKKPHVYWIVPPPVLYANRYITGFGQARSGIQCVLYNNHYSKSLKVLYMDVIPWFLRVYLHTLTLETGGKAISPEYLHYIPGKDRERPHHIEIVFTIPPRSEVKINFKFEYVFLKWTEYPPDANHGFYIGPATISTMLPTNHNFTVFPVPLLRRGLEMQYFLRIHTQVLLVSLPTPDFSMPYNVICLSCTVVALAFGPIHNVTTKSLQPVLEEDEEGLFKKLKKLFQKWKSGKPAQSTKSKDD